MADVSKVLKPRRGLKSTMASSAKKGTVLASGELFVEAPDTGVGTGQHKIKIGDGTTAYNSLPYAIGDTSNDKIEFSSNTATTVANALNSVASGQSLKTIIGGLKQAISLCNTSITQLNDETNKINVYVGNDGKIHFTNKAGADSVLPFSKGTEGFVETFTLPNIKLGAYNNGSTSVATSNMYIPLYGMNTVSFSITKNPYSSWYVYDHNGNTLKSKTDRSETTVSIELDVSVIDYIQIKNNPNGSGYGNCTIKNFTASV